MLKTIKNIPVLRFLEFKDAWNIKKIDEITLKISIPVNVDDDSYYQQIGIRSHGKGIFIKDLVTGKSLGDKRVFWVQEGVFIVNIVFAWEQAVAKTTKREIGMIASHRFPMYKPKEDFLDIDFILYLFLTKKGKNLLGLASPGGAGRNKTLGKTEFDKLKVTIPILLEQQKIAEFLTSVDELITKLQEKKSLLEKYKTGVMQKIFSQEIRFTDDNGNQYNDWEEEELGELLDYEQPTKYIVSSTEYSNDYETPVLTAGKSFILGYTNEKYGIYNCETPVIIFDDFTTANKFVDFPFKVKSSAMKILIAKSGVNIKYVYEAMQQIDYVIGGHERHWISKYSKLKINIPHTEEQQKIASFLSAIDAKITAVAGQIEQAQAYKKGLLQPAIPGV